MARPFPNIIFQHRIEQSATTQAPPLISRLATPERVRDNASHMQRSGAIMKTATFPSLRTTPELRQAAEQTLLEGETLSGFVEQAIRESIARRQNQQNFIARSLRSRDEARQSSQYVSADSVINRLEQMLSDAKGSR